VRNAPRSAHDHTETTRVLYVIVCAAGAAPEVGRLVAQAQQRGWDVNLIATPAAVNCLDTSALEAQTGRSVRSDYQQTEDGRGRSLPHADAIVVAPATYNTINKWAQGISDNYALGILAEAIGLGICVVVLPFVNAALAAHPAFQRSVRELREAGVTIVHGPGELEPHPPGTGSSRLDSFPWHLALDRADSLVPPRRRSGG
jgi:phosphopantothenoylcysteine synthetase/decarboxylase